MLLDRASALGLITALGAGAYRPHLALPACLGAQWRQEAGENRDAQREALVRAHAHVGNWLQGQFKAATRGSPSRWSRCSGARSGSGNAFVEFFPTIESARSPVRTHPSHIAVPVELAAILSNALLTFELDQRGEA